MTKNQLDGTSDELRLDIFSTTLNLAKGIGNLSVCLTNWLGTWYQYNLPPAILQQAH